MSEELSTETLEEMTARHDYWEAYLKEWVKTCPRANLAEISSPFSCISALMLLEKGESRSSIQKQLRWNWNTLANFEERHTQTIQENRRRFSRRFAMTASAGLDVLYKKFHQLLEDPEALSKADVKGIAIAVGVMADKGAQMDGMASQVIEHRKSGADMNDVLAMIEAAKERVSKKNPVIEAEVIP